MNNCGLHVLTPDELDTLGIERYEEIPNKGSAVGRALSGVGGEELILPRGAPRTFPPFPGATKNWNARTERVVRLVKEKAPGVICATYRNHGRTGEPWGIDIMISQFNQKANAAQENFGDILCNWAVKNWAWLNLNYIIYWNWMNDGTGWFDYEPYRLQWASGSQNLVSSRHQDHLHFQVDNPFRAGND